MTLSVRKTSPGFVAQAYDVLNTMLIEVNETSGMTDFRLTYRSEGTTIHIWEYYNLLILYLGDQD